MGGVSLLSGRDLSGGRKKIKDKGVGNQFDMLLRPFTHGGGGWGVVWGAVTERAG